jgi:hypothetical protein
MHSWNTFDAWTNHEYTWIHKTHHALDLREATTFPLIVFSIINHGGCIEMSFCFRTFKTPQNSQNYDSEIAIPYILDDHNFLWKPPIKLKPRENL